MSFLQGDGKKAQLWRVNFSIQLYCSKAINLTLTFFSILLKLLYPKNRGSYKHHRSCRSGKIPSYSKFLLYTLLLG